MVEPKKKMAGIHFFFHISSVCPQPPNQNHHKQAYEKISPWRPCLSTLSPACPKNPVPWKDDPSGGEHRAAHAAAHATGCFTLFHQQRPQPAHGGLRDWDGRLLTPGVAAGAVRAPGARAGGLGGGSRLGEFPGFSMSPPRQPHEGACRYGEGCAACGEGLRTPPHAPPAAR